MAKKPRPNGNFDGTDFNALVGSTQTLTTATSAPCLEISAFRKRS